MGKHKPIYDPSTDCGDYIVAVGCKDVHVTGKKMQQKKYYYHNTRPGSLKEMTMERMQAKWGGGELLKRAVRGMLPKNRLRDERLARLKCKSMRARREFVCGLLTWVGERLRGAVSSLQAEYPQTTAPGEHNASA
jgi:large subunit ribosomal protein L13